MRRIASLLRRLAGVAPPGDSLAPREYFRQMYERNWWRGRRSKSGPGSEGEFSSQKVALITGVIADHGVSSILDLGCGDFYWMREVAPRLARYHGVDVVPALVERNTREFRSPTASFQCLDLSDPDELRLLTVKRADLVVCLDVFGHLLNHEVDTLLRFVLDDIDARFFLVTNRRESGSADYLHREKTRREGIDIEQHPAFTARPPKHLRRIPALYPNDFFDLYDLASR